jgi:hypothetical protein
MFLSSTALVLGVILTRQEMRYFCARCQSQPPFQNLAGCNWNDIVVKVQASILTGKQTLGQRLEKAVEYVDNMVADDLLRTVVKTGAEVVTGVAGGIVLYSLPEHIFPQTTSDVLMSNEESNALTPTSHMRSIRRRVIHTVDPSLDGILFRPGGLWGITPSGFRDTLITLTRIANIGRPSFVCDAPTVESTADGSGSHDLEEEELVTPHGSLPTLIHVRQPQQIVENSTVSEGGLENAKTDEATQKDAGKLKRNDKLINKETIQNRDTSSPPQWQIEKILQRTAIAASLCFVLHLYKSPSTRKTWRSAISFLASCGMLSTAVGTASASKLLSSTLKNIASNENSLCGTMCLNTLERITSFQSVHAKVHGLVNRFWKEIKANKRLQISLAFTVMYGFKRSQTALKGRPGGRAP